MAKILVASDGAMLNGITSEEEFKKIAEKFV